MSQPRFTPEQLDAIEARGGTILVSAAAGSGKTAVLVERVTRLLTDPEQPIDADRLGVPGGRADQRGSVVVPGRHVSVPTERG